MSDDEIWALAKQCGMREESWMTNPPQFAGLWTEREAVFAFGRALCARWISVKDRLPAEGEWVLAKVLGDDVRPDIARLEHGEWMDLFTDTINVTHWMPIPALPR